MMVTIDWSVINNDIPFYLYSYGGICNNNQHERANHTRGLGGKRTKYQHLTKWDEEKSMCLTFFTRCVASRHAPGIHGYRYVYMLLLVVYQDHLIETTPSSKSAIRLKAAGLNYSTCLLVTFLVVLGVNSYINITIATAGTCIHDLDTDTSFRTLYQHVSNW